MESSVEVLGDHYKDSVARQDLNVKKRDKVFYLILGVIVLMLFKIFLSGQLASIVAQVSLTKLGLTESLNIDFLNSVLWFILLMLIMLYLQLRTNVERLYTYIHYLESELNKIFGGNAFTREGESYLKQYPCFLQWAHFIYNVLFPSIFIIIISIKIGSEWVDVCKAKTFSYLVVIDSLFFLTILVSIILAYIFEILESKKEKEQLNKSNV